MGCRSRRQCQSAAADVTLGWMTEPGISNDSTGRQEKKKEKNKRQCKDKGKEYFGVLEKACESAEKHFPPSSDIQGKAMVQTVLLHY